jgi:NAD(P)-dependent dehydrogenase (short-subunit alcohol dehydrogenase family)
MVRDFAKQGANVVVSNKSNDGELDRTVGELKDDFDTEVLGVQLDIGDPEQVSTTYNQIKDEIGPVDILVNNAGIRPYQSIEEVTLEDWEQTIRTNLTGAFLCTRTVLQDMRDNEWGRIISISGLDAFTGSAYRIHNVSTKAGLWGLREH